MSLSMTFTLISYNLYCGPSDLPEVVALLEYNLVFQVVVLPQIEPDDPPGFEDISFYLYKPSLTCCSEESDAAFSWRWCVSDGQKAQSLSPLEQMSLFWWTLECLQQ